MLVVGAEHVVASTILNTLLGREDFWRNEVVVHVVHNIKATLEAMACRHTAEYIIRNDSATKAEQIEGEEEVLAYALDKAPNGGMACEFGVGFGKTIKQIAKVRPVHGFDSFKGLPETWRSGLPKGSFSRAGMVADDIEAIEGITLWRGMFADTIPQFIEKHGDTLDKYGIGFLHVDSDLYSSAVTILNSELRFYLRNRSIILFDEYWNWPGWQMDGRGEHSALMEWEITGWKYIAYNITGQEVVVRIVQNG